MDISEMLTTAVTLEKNGYMFIVDAYFKNNDGIQKSVPFNKLPDDFKRDIIAYLISKV